MHIKCDIYLWIGEVCVSCAGGVLFWRDETVTTLKCGLSTDRLPEAADDVVLTSLSNGVSEECQPNLASISPCLDRSAKELGKDEFTNTVDDLIGSFEEDSRVGSIEVWDSICDDVIGDVIEVLWDVIETPCDVTEVPGDVTEVPCGGIGDVTDILGDVIDDVIEAAGVVIDNISSDFMCNAVSFADNSSDAVTIVDDETDALVVADNEDDDNLISLLTPDVFEGTER